MARKKNTGSAYHHQGTRYPKNVKAPDEDRCIYCGEFILWEEAIENPRTGMLAHPECHPRYPKGKK